MRLGHEYSIDIKTAHFKFTPYHKINVIVDKSGVGKTTLLKEIAYNGMYTDMRVLFSYGELSILTGTCDYLLILDDSHVFKLIDKCGVDAITNSNNVFLIMCRELLDFAPIDYRAIYTIEADGRYYTTKRKFPDYETFKHSSNYLIEDSNFGKTT